MGARPTGRVSRLAAVRGATGLLAAVLLVLLVTAPRAHAADRLYFANESGGGDPLVAFATLDASFSGGNLVPPVLYKGTGCRQCQDTGYRGRRGIFEMMPMSDEIRSLCLERAPAHTIRKVATQQGMRSLREDGWRLIREGVTTVDEVLQNTKDETTAVGAER